MNLLIIGLRMPRPSLRELTTTDSELILILYFLSQPSSLWQWPVSNRYEVLGLLWLWSQLIQSSRKTWRIISLITRSLLIDILLWRICLPHLPVKLTSAPIGAWKEIRKLLRTDQQTDLRTHTAHREVTLLSSYLQFNSIFRYSCSYEFLLPQACRRVSRCASWPSV